MVQLLAEREKKIVFIVAIVFIGIIVSIALIGIFTILNFYYRTFDDYVSELRKAGYTVRSADWNLWNGVYLAEIKCDWKKFLRELNEKPYWRPIYADSHEKVLWFESGSVGDYLVYVYV